MNVLRKNSGSNTTETSKLLAEGYLVHKFFLHLGKVIPF